VLTINAALHHATGLRPSLCDAQLKQASFPPMLADLKLDALLRLIRFLGSIQEKGILRRRQIGLVRTDVNTAVNIATEAASVLADWPRSFRGMLRRIVPRQIETSALNFQEIFGNFYRHLYAVLPREEFGLLHEAFEEFVAGDWKGLIRGQHRFFSAAVRSNSQWIPTQEAETMSRLHSKRLVALVRRGELEGIFVQIGRRTECWIRRTSLNRWAADREAELALYMPRPEAKQALGLKHDTILKVARSGLIRYVEGSEKSFRTNCIYFRREDVLKIKHAFEKSGVGLRCYSRPGELIALHHALKNYLGCDAGLPSAIRAVVEGKLAPVGYTKCFRGITGYLFRSEDLRRYRPVQTELPPGGFLNYKEAAFSLGTRTEVIRGLVSHGVLSTPNEYQPGLAKLVPAGEVQRFAAQYMDASVLAKSSGETIHWVSRCLRQAGVPILEIVLKGKGHKIFLRKEVAKKIRILRRCCRSGRNVNNCAKHAR